MSEAGHPSGEEYRAPKTPERRMGVFKSLEMVPYEYRLGKENPAGLGDPWDEYMAPKREQLADSTLADYDRLWRYWTSYMADEDRHPALADPEHVEEFLSDLRADRAPATMFYTYFSTLNEFYGWLRDHAEYPHVYSPVLMAASNGGATRECWEYRNDLADQRFDGDDE